MVYWLSFANNKKPLKGIVLNKLCGQNSCRGWNFTAAVISISFCDWWELVQISVPRRQPSHFLLFHLSRCFECSGEFHCIVAFVKTRKEMKSVLKWFQVAYKRLIKRSRDGDFKHALGCLDLTCQVIRKPITVQLANVTSVNETVLRQAWPDHKGVKLL